MNEKDTEIIIRLISFFKEKLIYLCKELLVIKMPNFEMTVFSFALWNPDSTESCFFYMQDWRVSPKHGRHTTSTCPFKINSSFHTCLFLRISLSLWTSMCLLVVSGQTSDSKTKVNRWTCWNWRPFFAVNYFTRRKDHQRGLNGWRQVFRWSQYYIQAALFFF